MVDFSRPESVGTLCVLRLPVLKGLYAANAKDRAKWVTQIPKWIRWACTIRWYMDFTQVHSRAEPFLADPSTEKDSAYKLYLDQLYSRTENQCRLSRRYGLIHIADRPKF